MTGSRESSSPAGFRYQPELLHKAEERRLLQAMEKLHFKPFEFQGFTIFPLGYPIEDDVKDATLEFYLGLAEDYIGSPMLSALYGVWAAVAGNRSLSARLVEDGYGRFCVGRFMQTLEYREDVFPEQPRAGPFFANLGGFLNGLLMGFTGIRPTAEDPMSWATRAVVLPEGWKSIEVERLSIHGRNARFGGSTRSTSCLSPTLLIGSGRNEDPFAGPP